ncbi:MAG: ribonuclease T2-like protein [Podila humilis]|nr:MAG: ribonuclease T2-like protein [Podila humilis]
MPRRDTCPRDVLSCSLESRHVNTCCVPKYGLVVLSQQWHPQMGPMNEFTLHGQWPDQCGGNFVEHCDTGRERDDVEDRLEQTDIYDDMKKYWPSFKPTPQRPDNNYFWSYEWNKHGTCVSTLEPGCGYQGDQDLYAYFNKTLALRKQYNIYKALKKAGITPRPSFDRDPREDDKYSVDAILAAIKDEWNVTAAVNCKSGNPLEIHLFFNVRNKDTYELTDAIPSQMDCPHTRKVVYWEKQPLQQRGSMSRT